MNKVEITEDLPSARLTLNESRRVLTDASSLLMERTDLSDEAYDCGSLVVAYIFDVIDGEENSGLGANEPQAKFCFGSMVSIAKGRMYQDVINGTLSASIDEARKGSLAFTIDSTVAYQRLIEN